MAITEQETSPEMPPGIPSGGSLKLPARPLPRTARVASVEQELAQFVAVTVDEQLFGFPISFVQDIFERAPVTRVPLAQSYVCGLLNLRGRIVTVLDLRAILARQTLPVESYRFLVNVNHGGDFYSFLVDRVGDAMRIDDQAILPVPTNLEPPVRKISRGVVRLEDAIAVIIDPEALMRAITLGPGAGAGRSGARRKLSPDGTGAHWASLMS